MLDKFEHPPKFVYTNFKRAGSPNFGTLFWSFPPAGGF